MYGPPKIRTQFRDSDGTFRPFDGTPVFHYFYCEFGLQTFCGFLSDLRLQYLIPSLNFLDPKIPVTSSDQCHQWEVNLPPWQPGPKWPVDPPWRLLSGTTANQEARIKYDVTHYVRDENTCAEQGECRLGTFWTHSGSFRLLPGLTSSLNDGWRH
jgi:hypothetical protein